jgi:hypothetical protein
MSTPRNDRTDRDADGIRDDREPRVDRDRDGVDDRTEVVDRDGGVTDGGVRTTPVAAPAEREVVVETPDRRAVVDRERAEYGGIKFGSAFFGWLTATGMGVLLTALIAATGLAVRLGEAAEEAADQAGTITIVGAIVLVIVLFVSYFCGGYVAGRMARFDGAKQGLAVWLWAIIAAVVVAVLGFIFGAQYDVLANLDSFPRIPIRPEDMTVAGIITALVLAIVSLLGAIVGGLAGMRFHRKVDRAGLGD